MAFRILHWGVALSIFVTTWASAQSTDVLASRIEEALSGQDETHDMQILRSGQGWVTSTVKMHIISATASCDTIQYDEAEDVDDRSATTYLFRPSAVIVSIVNDKVVVNCNDGARCIKYFPKLAKYTSGNTEFYNPMNGYTDKLSEKVEPPALAGRLVKDINNLNRSCLDRTSNDRSNHHVSIGQRASAQITPQNSEEESQGQSDHGDHQNSGISQALSNFVASGGFAANGLNPQQPLPAYGSQLASGGPRRPASPTQSFTAKPRNADTNSTTSAKISSYRNHPELDAGSCLTFHGPIDLYGERVTNRCGYPVTYIFCIDGAHSALACKINGDDIGAGTDTVGAGQTQDTGFVDARGGSVQNHWHACKGKSGDVIPLMETRNLGRCMSY